MHVILSSSFEREVISMLHPLLDTMSVCKTADSVCDFGRTGLYTVWNV